MQQPQILSIPLADTQNDWQGDTKYQQIARGPSLANGGGLTILEAWAVNHAATTSGTTHSLQLLNYGTAGTAVKSTGGTISNAIGGTADAWAESVPKAFTLVAAGQYIGPGEYVVILKDEENSSDPTRGLVNIIYKIGK